ncbi:hypothetical protein [Labilithrix luteola]|nr:hypothetical protein [Labilithrix luteola]
MAASVDLQNSNAQTQGAQLRRGVATIAVALGLAVLLRETGASHRTILLLVPFFFLGIYGVQASFMGTCSIAAMRGVRLTASGAEPICDRGRRAKLRRRGLGLIASSAAAAVLAGALLAFAH